MTAAELGELLELSTDTILDRFQRGDLPGFRLFGRKGGPVRFRWSEIAELLDSWKVGARGGAPAPPQRPPEASVVSRSPAPPNRGGSGVR